MHFERSTLHPFADPQFQLIAGISQGAEDKNLIVLSCEDGPSFKGGGWKTRHA
jgi:hypothetical protein